jgi:hypothetical protein
MISKGKSIGGIFFDSVGVVAYRGVLMPIKGNIMDRVTSVGDPEALNLAHSTRC